MGQILFAGIVFYLITGSEEAISEGSMFTYVVPAVAIGNIGLAFYIYKMRAAQGSQIDHVEGKFGHYKVSNMIRWAIVEAANIIAVVAALVEQNTYYLLFFLIGMAGFVMFRPSMPGFLKEYKISLDEAKQIKETMM